MGLKEISKTSIQSALSLIIILGGLLFLAFVPSDQVTRTTVGNMMLLVLGFYFGSSRNSSKKDDTISQLAENNNS